MESVSLNKDKENSVVLESLFATFYPTLSAFCAKYVKDKDISRDIVQDIFLTVWENRSKIDFSTPLHSYLLKLAHNQCINYLEHLKVKNKYIDATKLKLMEMEVGYDDLFDKLVADAIQEQIEKTVEQLPAQCRDIFRKSRYEGMTHAEIAKELDISLRTVETQIYRALKTLKKVIKSI